MKRLVLVLVGVLLMLPVAVLGAGADNLPAGKLLIVPVGSQVPYSSRVDREQLTHFCFFSSQLIAKDTAIIVQSLEIAVEAHNLPRRSWQAAQMSAQNTDKIWLCVKRQKQGTTTQQYYEANVYRLVQRSKVAGETNQMIIGFTNLDLRVEPGEIVRLSFYGSFYPYVQAGTVIRGSVVPEAWRHTAKTIRFEQSAAEQQYIVQ